MFENRLSTNDWLQLPHLTRLDLARIFNLKRSTGSQIQDNTIISDGHTYDDLGGINCATMSLYLGLPVINDEPFEPLFQRVLETIEKAHKVIEEEAKALADVIIPALQPQKIPVVDIPFEEAVSIKRRGRPPGSKNK